MSSRFAELLRTFVEPTADRIFGEPVRIEPMVRGQYTGSVPDPAREPVVATGIVSERAEAATLDGDVPGNNRFRGKIDQRPMRVSFDRSAFAGRSTWPRQGDRIVRLGLTGEPAYEAERDAYPNGPTRIDVDLVSM